MDFFIRWLGTRVPLLFIVVGISCSADVPSIGNDGNIDIQCTPYADVVVAFTTAAGAGDGDPALGMPDGASVTLATNDVLTLAFVGLGSIVNEAGDDLRIHGSAASGSAVAYVSDDGDNFEFLSNVEDGALDFDLGPSRLTSIRYLRVIGQSGSVTVDAAESLSSTCP
jgi:hypothetical protein